MPEVLEVRELGGDDHLAVGARDDPSPSGKGRREIDFLAQKTHGFQSSHQLAAMGAFDRGLELIGRLELSRWRDFVRFLLFIPLHQASFRLILPVSIRTATRPESAAGV